MIDIKKLKENSKDFLMNFKNKGFSLEKEIVDVLNDYEEYLKYLKQEEIARSTLNDISKLLANGSLENKTKAKEISDLVKQVSEKTTLFLNRWEEKLSYFPNTYFEGTPIGENEKHNKVVFQHLEENKKIGKAHYEIFDLKKDLVFNEESSYISGSRNVIFGEKLSKLILALENFMLEIHTKDNFSLIEAPVIVNEKALFNTGQLPKFKDDLFRLENGKFLIPTSEVTLTNFFAGKTFDSSLLPLKVTSLSNCFRSEAGSAGKDTRGIMRLHQFRKVEIVMIGKKESFKIDLKNMIDQASKILNLLEIPYRIVELCTGDMSFASAKSFDIEVWLPGQNDYREISSISCMSDFQSRRMQTKHKDSKGNKELVYTYNGSALAIERTLVAIIENYYDPKTNNIHIPKVLKKYLEYEYI